MTKLLAIVFLGALILLSCKEQAVERQDNCEIIEKFNTEASTAFQKKYLGSHDLDSMNKRDRCILEKTVANYLDQTNNWSTSVIDSFYVRSYNFSDFIDRFSFVTKGNGEYYFIYVPEFNDIFSKSSKFYSVDQFGKLKLNDSSKNYVLKFRMQLLNEFLAKEVTHSKRFTDQVTQVERLLPSILPHLFLDRCHLFDFTDSLSNRPMHQRNEIMRILEQVIPPKDLTLGISTTSRQVYRNVFGFVIIHFKESERTNNLELDFYFIPDQYSGRYIRHGDPIFGECNQL